MPAPRYYQLLTRRQNVSELSCVRSVILSITHKFSTRFDSEVNIGESRQPTPQDRIAGRAIVFAMEVAAKSGHGQVVVGQVLWKGVPWIAGLLVQNRNFELRQNRVGRRFRIRSMNHRQPEHPPSVQTRA